MVSRQWAASQSNIMKVELCFPFGVVNVRWMGQWGGWGSGVDGHEVGYCSSCEAPTVGGRRALRGGALCGGDRLMIDVHNNTTNT